MKKFRIIAAGVAKVSIIPLCKHVVAKVTLVPCSVNLSGKRDKCGHGNGTINNAGIIIGNLFTCLFVMRFNVPVYNFSVMPGWSQCFL